MKKNRNRGRRAGRDYGDWRRIEPSWHGKCWGQVTYSGTGQSSQTHGTQNRRREIEEAMKDMISTFKETITGVMLGMEEANAMTVLKSVKDPSSLAICPYTEESEELMPMEEIPSSKSMVAKIHDMEPLSDEQRMQIAELFDDMEVTHDHLMWSCSLSATLLR